MKITGLMTAILLLAGLLVAPALVAQDKTMYKWTDENGVVHFTDKKPPEVDAAQEAIPTIQASSGPNPYEGVGADTASQAELKRQQIAQKSDENRARQQAMNANCNSWRSQLSRIEPNRRVFYTNDQGETVRMDDVERTNMVAELKQKIAQNCN